MTEKTTALCSTWREIPAGRLEMYGVDRSVPQWRVRGVNGALAGRTFLLYGTMILGRGDHCDICFPEDTPGVSRRHCALAAVGNQVALWDLGSAWGTYAGQERLEGRAPRSMENGTFFSLGKDGPLFRLEALDKEETTRTDTFSILSARGVQYGAAQGQRLRIGRRKGNDVCLPPEALSVSGSHCLLFRENGQLYLRDLGSLNGTYLNGCRLNSHVSYRVVKGNSFYLGEKKYLFTIL